jgi:hypothetical protein
MASFTILFAYSYFSKYFSGKVSKLNIFYMPFFLNLMIFPSQEMFIQSVSPHRVKPSLSIIILLFFLSIYLITMPSVLSGERMVFLLSKAFFLTL